MKFFLAVLLLAIVAIAYAEEAKKEALSSKAEEVESAPRDKRGVLLGAAAYTAPIAYSAPIVYSGYNVPYAYSAYRTYPYSYPYYSSPYIYG